MMRVMSLLAAAVFGTVFSLGLSAAEPAKRPLLNRCADATYSLGGPIDRYVDAVVANWLLRAPRSNPAMLQMFADRDTQPYRDLLPWSGEFAGKYLTGATQVARLTADERLEKFIASFVDGLLAQQADDGYLGPFSKENRLTGSAPNVSGAVTWDAWGHYHIMLGLLMWSEDTGDAKALEAARRIGDLLCDNFGEADRNISAMGSTEMNQAVVHSLALLHERTGDAKYRDLAERVVEDFSAPGAGDYFRLGARGVKFFQVPKPRWESLHPIMGLAELYWISENEEYAKAFENLWWSMAEFDRHNNGGFSSGEQAQGNPYHPGAIETCCTIAWMAMSVEMLRMTGDSCVADELELSTLNQVVGIHSADCKWSTYNTPMDGRRVPSTVDIAFQIRPGSEELNCCSVNAARGFGMITDWAVMRDKQGLILNWYGPSTITASVDDVPVVLTQNTDYPVGGRIELRVEPSQPVEFALKLRIPHWSANTKVTVNGEVQSTEPGSYLSIDRRWQSGDKVQIEMDMSPHYWVGERECEGSVSIYHGPILLTYEKPNAEASMPTLDARQIGTHATATAIDSGILTMNVDDVNGQSVLLRDFGSAGQNGTWYASWLPVQGVNPAPFSKKNPTRSSRVAN